LQQLVRDYCESGSFLPRLVKELSDEDKEVFSKILKTCKLDVAVEKASPLMDRFQVVKGMIRAGNDNPELLTELKELTRKLHNHKLIKKGEANAILAQFS